MTKENGKESTSLIQIVVVFVIFGAIFITLDRIHSHKSKTPYQRGVSHQRKGNYDRAIDQYTLALQQNPGNVKAYINRGAAYAARGDYDRAIEDDNRAVELKPGHANGWYNRACHYSLKGNRDKALADLARAISLDVKYQEIARQDRDFKNLRDDKDFKKMVNIGVSP